MRFRIWDKVKEEFTKDRIFMDNTGKIYKITKENKILDIDSKFCILNFSIEHRDKNNKEIFEGDIIKYGEKYFQIIYRKEISSWSINFSKKMLLLKLKVESSFGKLKNEKWIYEIIETIENIENI